MPMRFVIRALSDVDGKPVKIEIFGLPGVGKTYLMNLLVTKYPDINNYLLRYDLPHWLERIYDIPYHIRHPYLIYLCSLEKNRDAMIIRFKRIARRKRYMVKQNRCILDDSGVIQPLIEAYILSENHHLKIDWIKLFNEIIMDHCYFFINDSIDDIVSRELNRDVRRFGLNRKNLILKYAECLKVINIIKQKMYYYEFPIHEYRSTNDLIDNLYKKMADVLSHA